MFQPTSGITSVVLKNRMISALLGLLERLSLNNPFTLCGLYGSALPGPAEAVEDTSTSLCAFPQSQKQPPLVLRWQKLVCPHTSLQLSLLWGQQGIADCGGYNGCHHHTQMPRLKSILRWTLYLNFKQSHYSWNIFPHEWIISRQYKNQSYDQMQCKSYDCCPWFKRSRNPCRTLSSRRAFNKSCESVRKIWKKRRHW